MEKNKWFKLVCEVRKGFNLKKVIQDVRLKLEYDEGGYTFNAEIYAERSGNRYELTAFSENYQCTLFRAPDPERNENIIVAGSSLEGSLDMWKEKLINETLEILESGKKKHYPR